LAIKTLTRLEKKDQPFYLALGYFRPHLPFAVPKKYWDLYQREQIPMATNPQVPKNSPVMSMNSMYELRGYDGFADLKHPLMNKMAEDTARILKHGYYASVSYVDAQLGRIIQHLKDLGLFENTIIVVWGDHGWKLGEHNSWCKQSNYQIDTHVPLIVYSSDLKNRGKQTSALTELIDIFPSLCEMSGIEVPEYSQGTSFVPLLDELDRPWKNAVFSQFHRRPKVTPDGKRYMGYSILTEQYHYIEWYYWDNVKKEKETFVTSELYNRGIDPDENENVAQYPENEKLIQVLSDQLKQGWRKAKPVLL